MEENLHYLHVHSFPKNLRSDDKTEFLVSFGAVSVHEVSHRSRKQAVIAGFRSQEDCNFALSLLNQVTLLDRPLRASIWHKDNKSVVEKVCNLAAPEQDVSWQDKYEAQLSAISSHLGLTQPLPPHLKYKYPAPTATCLANIANAMVAVPKFYTQVCHLMNKMNLPPPFGAPVNYAKEVREAIISAGTLQSDYLRLERENISSCDDENDFRISRTNNQKVSVPVEDDGENTSYLSRHFDRNISNALLGKRRKDCNVLLEGNGNAVLTPDLKRDQVRRTAVAGSGEERSPVLEGESICASCMRPYSRNDQDMTLPTSPMDELISEDRLESSNMSESSESELESDQELSLSSVSPSTLEKLKALKRPRATKNVSFDSRKRAKLQLKTNSDMSNSGRNSLTKSKSNIPEPFTSVKDLSHNKKLQLKIPNSLPIKGTNVGKNVSPGTTESRIMLENPSSIESTSQAPIGAGEFNISPSASAATVGAGDSSAESLDDTNTGGAGIGEHREALPAFGKIQVISTVKKLVRSHENFVSIEELENNRIKESEYPVVPVLAKYSPGHPSSRLYIKNLAKSVSVGHLQRIYDRFVMDYFSSVASREDDGPVNIRADDTKYNVRVMQEGRMKGQAFITLPSVAVAEEARRLTNGYILQDKPMVVSFARARPGQ